MSSLAIDTSLKRTYGIYDVYIGKKLVMAVTGVILFGYVIAHLAGNLQIFLGPEQMNRYAGFLHSHENLLWVARAVLLASVGLHIWSAVLLWLQKRRARPVAYVKKGHLPPSYASRTMYWSGPIIAAFVIFHVLHLTVGAVGLGFEEPTPGPAGMQFHAYENVIHGFRHPLVSFAYMFAMALLSMHLYHGVWSMFQSVGLSHPKHSRLVKQAAHGIAWLIFLGYISIPIYVMVWDGVDIWIPSWLGVF
jgi:succinate dehydrogenase / fumarate reductase cytochrome b subunit